MRHKTLYLYGVFLIKLPYMGVALDLLLSHIFSGATKLELDKFSSRLHCFSGNSLAALIMAGCWCIVLFLNIK